MPVKPFLPMCAQGGEEMGEVQKFEGGQLGHCKTEWEALAL